ncbi:hypothetical protein EMPS_02551 [Entomortierella parvispora]|uniref:Uncharacterized protein n=1 Tax=Entomortierella parvispora TaxID=205924 RepID=A0A9P3H5N3_9FUNG|nr:hypothetical protein EMPS_02551 [Entomortierella parvispora]
MYKRNCTLQLQHRNTTDPSSRLLTRNSANNARNGHNNSFSRSIPTNLRYNLALRRPVDTVLSQYPLKDPQQDHCAPSIQDDIHFFESMRHHSACLPCRSRYHGNVLLRTDRQSMRRFLYDI